MLAAAFVVGIGLIAAFVGSSSAGPTIGTKIHHAPLVAPASFTGSVRALTPPAQRANRVFPAPRAEREFDPALGPKHELPGAAAPSEAPSVASAPAPAPSISFKGLDFLDWGAGWPPDTVGDVGPTHFVQAVNTSVGIFRKSDGAQLAAFTYDTLFSGTGTACDASNQGDPTVVYDPLGDRWIVADFAFTGTGSSPPFFECIAVSKTSDPVNGGWWLYAIRADDTAHPWFPDYPKMGIWPDGLYMTANMFDGNTYREVRVWALNRADLESGAAVRNVVVDVGSASYFSLMPSNMRTAVGAPPAGRPNLLVSESESLFAFEVWKFHVDYSGSGSTFTGPTNVSQTSYTGAPLTVTSPKNSLDSLSERLMMQAQYTNIGGAESVWVNHTVSCCGGSTLAGIQWAQLDVTGGTVATTPVQQQIYPPASDGLHRWMGSLAVDKSGDMALGYSVSNKTTNPDIRYAGRLVGDPLNTLPQTETTMLSGVTRGTQSGSCGGTCNRWGDYSAMTIDPDGCRFWYTQEYYETTGLSWQTRVGSFSFPSCGGAKLSQTITFDPLGGKTFGDADFAVSATASSGLTVSFSALGNCTVVGSTVHLTGAGSCTITASQAGDATYNAAPDMARTFTIAKAGQTISFGAIAGKTYGDSDFAVSATASSGLAVSFGASGNCTVSGSTVHITGAGSCTVTGSQAGNSNYNAAPSVPQAFSIAKASQTIAFGALPDKTFGDTNFTVGASATSGLAVTFAVGGNCTIAGTTVHITGAGSCTVTASQAGNANYNAAPDVPRSFSIAKAGQTIAFAALPGKTFGDADFSVAATASSGLAVSFAAAGDCTVTVATVHITGAGSCTVTASQAGNSNYNAAPDVPRAFSIGKASQTITFPAIADTTLGAPDIDPGATASSGLSVAYEASGPCSMTVESKVHISGVGTCTVTASQAGDANYNAAPDVGRSFAIKTGQTITFGALSAKTFGDPDVLVSATASSGLPVSFAAAGNCSIMSGTTVHITGAGSCTVTATQPGNAEYFAAPDVARSFSIAKAGQTIAFGALANRTYGDPDFGVSASASSSLPVSFAATGDCAASGGTVHLVGAGSCTVTASQPGSVNYNAAPDIARSFSIAKAGQAISFGALPDKTYGDADFGVGASASSGLPVVFAAGGNCMLVGSTVRLTGAGGCTVTASQLGDSNYEAAPDVSRALAVAKASQAISFGALAGKTFGDPDFSVGATASSGLPVTFAALGSCTLAGSSVGITGAGSCTVTASQTGDANYNAAAPVLQSFVIAKASQAISFGTLAGKTYGDANFGVAATASSGLAVSFAAGGSCSAAGAIVHLTGAGSCTITASQAGNANYNAAADVARSFSIARPPLTPAASCKVPKVVGKSLAAAKRALKARHCGVGKVSYAYSRTHKKGTVSSQSRRPGKLLARNTKVNVVVSRGRRP